MFDCSAEKSFLVHLSNLRWSPCRAWNPRSRRLVGRLYRSTKLSSSVEPWVKGFPCSPILMWWANFWYFSYKPSSLSLLFVFSDLSYKNCRLSARTLSFIQPHRINNHWFPIITEVGNFFSSCSCFGVFKEYFHFFFLRIWRRNCLSSGSFVWTTSAVRPSSPATSCTPCLRRRTPLRRNRGNQRSPKPTTGPPTWTTSTKLKSRLSAFCFTTRSKLVIVLASTEHIRQLRFYVLISKSPCETSNASWFFRVGFKVT